MNIEPSAPMASTSGSLGHAPAAARPAEGLADPPIGVVGVIVFVNGHVCQAMRHAFHGGPQLRRRIALVPGHQSQEHAGVPVRVGKVLARWGVLVADPFVPGPVRAGDGIEQAVIPDGVLHRAHHVL